LHKLRLCIYHIPFWQISEKDSLETGKRDDVGAGSDGGSGIALPVQ